MAYSNIKEKLISIVQDGDEELLQLIYDTVEQYKHKEENEWTKTELEWLTNQTELREKGELNLVSWNDAKMQIVDRRKVKEK